MNLLEQLWAGQDGYGELRAIRGRDIRQEWLMAPPRAHDDDIAALDEEGWDIYFGVLPRTRKQGTADACVPTTSVLWADVDAKNTGGKWAGMVGIKALKQPPTIIVDSGRGFHIYHLLRDPVPFERARAAMKGIAREVQGDHVYDAARVLRVPGTHNHKTDPPTPVRILYWDIERRYRISDFDAYEEPEHLHRFEYVERVPGSPSWLTELIRDGAPRGTRSETCFRTIVWMMRYGWSDNAITEAFERNPQGIGEKYHEKGRDGHRWLALTIEAARRANDG